MDPKTFHCQTAGYNPHITSASEETSGETTKCWGKRFFPSGIGYYRTDHPSTFYFKYEEKKKII